MKIIVGITGALPLALINDRTSRNKKIKVLNKN